METTYMDFRKVIYENVEKKNIHFTKNISIYESQKIRQFYDVLFCTYCKRFVLSLKHSQH